MEAVIAVVVILVVVGVLGYVTWISVQSLMQAGVLRRALPLEALKDNLDRPVAVHGSPQCEGPSQGPFGAPVIWFKRQEQVYRRHGKSGSWHTVDSEERMHSFVLHFPDGGSVRVREKPTEVQGLESRTEKPSWLSNHRTVYQWLPLCPGLTVMGKIVLSNQGATLTPDPKLGLLFSVRTPQAAAAVETAKGVGGLLLVLGALAFGAFLILNFNR